MKYLVISVFFVSFLQIYSSYADKMKQKPENPAKKALPKDPLYISDIDLENLYDQWEDSDDEKLPQDELPPHKRQMKSSITPPGGMDELMKNPDELMKFSKKGKTVMAFVTVANNPTKEETEEITQRWQVGLSNAHMRCQRFVIDKDRAIFVFEDGSLAFEAKEYFMQQPELKEYSIDNRTWQGKGYPVEQVEPNSATGDKTSKSANRDEL